MRARFFVLEDKMKSTLTSELDSLQPTDLDAGRVFSGKPSGTTVRGYAAASAYTPAIDRDSLLSG